MNRPTLRRREFLIGATTTAGLLMPGAVWWQSTATPGSGVPLIPRRVLFADPARTWVRISPDGTRIAFLAPIDTVLNLWVGPIGDVTKARAVTRVTDRSLATSYLWLHDNRHLVFFREQGGDENWQAHRVDVRTDASRRDGAGGGACA